MTRKVLLPPGVPFLFKLLLIVFAPPFGVYAISRVAAAVSHDVLPSWAWVLAAVLSAMALVALFMLGIGEFIFTDGPVNALCAHVSVWTQMNDFSRGIVDLRRITFDATLILLPLFVAVRAVDAWRWG